MTRKMVVNAVDPEEVRIAILNEARLEDFDIETRGTERNKGNIYKARIIDVEPSLNAAFVDYGADKQGFLTAGDVDPRRLHDKNKRNGNGSRDRSPKIDDLLKKGQNILVQVTKDEVGSKGAVLTTYLSLAGRYLVLTPDSRHQGVSRKIADEATRDALFETMEQLDVPEGMGAILRTAGGDRSPMDLNRDLSVLVRLWENIMSEADQAKAPALIFKEQDVIIRALRDYYTADIDEVVLDSDEAYDRAAEYMHLVMPHQRSVLTRYVERRPIFHHYRIEPQLQDLYNPRVPLPSGGSVVMEPTEALVSVDVNSGKQKSGGHEETAVQTNLEAAAEIARQLKLRDLGGIVVIDFIDMLSRRNQARVERALKAVLKNDKARIKVGRISRNGTLELTRQRIRTALAASVFSPCTVCHGTGRILNPTSHAAAILRRLLDRASRGDLLTATVKVETEAANILRTDKWNVIQEIEQTYNVRIEVAPESGFSAGHDDFTFETNPEVEPIDLPQPNFGPAVLPDEMRAELEAAAAEEEAESKVIEEEATVARAKRRRARRRGKKRKETKQKFDLPSFELVDPADLGLKGSSDKSDGRRRRRRRPRKRRSEPTATRPDTNKAATAAVGGAVEAAPAPKEEAAPKKRGFWSWLLGRKE